MRVLLAGVGNVLRGDDGFGPRAAAAFAGDARLPEAATVIETGSGLALDVCGQRIGLPPSGLHAMGAKLWLSVLDVMPRPEPGDSAKNRP